MDCPDCGARARVVETRAASGNGAPRVARELAAWLGGEVVYRRRVCTSCARQWATTELLQDDLLALRARLGTQ